MSNEVPQEECDELMAGITAALRVVGRRCDDPSETGMPCASCAANAFGGVLASLEFEDAEMDRVRSSWAKHVLEREMRK
jgi:hypothetical protein